MRGGVIARLTGFSIWQFIKYIKEELLIVLGTSIYLTMAAMFVAQATNVPLTLGDQLTILGVLLLSSKGAAAITGGGFITLAATLGSVSTVPVAGLALILGVDRFMSEARALTNLIGNGVATVVVAKLDKELDVASLRRHLAQETALDAEEPEKEFDQELGVERTRRHLAQETVLEAKEPEKEIG